MACQRSKSAIRALLHLPLSLYSAWWLGSSIEEGRRENEVWGDDTGAAIDLPLASVIVSLGALRVKGLRMLRGMMLLEIGKRYAAVTLRRVDNALVMQIQRGRRLSGWDGS